MGFDVLGLAPASESGEYFRNSVWGWRPLANYVLEVCDDLFESGETQYWQTNDGHEVSAETALKIANRLRYLLDSGDVKRYKKQYDNRLASLPDEQCEYCQGTGERHDQYVDGVCNGCQGAGKVRPFDTHYPFDVENVEEFQQFCASCGGFEIW